MKSVIKKLMIIVFMAIIGFSLISCAECSHCNGTGTSCMKNDCVFECSTSITMSLGGGPITYPDCGKCGGSGKSLF